MPQKQIPQSLVSSGRMKLAQLSMISWQMSENTYFLGPSSLYEPDPDLESACENALQRGTGGPRNFLCLVCGKSSISYSKARNHFEAKHYSSPGYTCDICSQFCKTRHGLECHRSRNHPARSWAFKVKVKYIVPTVAEVWNCLPGLELTLVIPGEPEEANRLENLATQYLSKLPTGGFSCSICSKVSKDRYAGKCHLDSKHFPSEYGHTCRVCGYHCKSKAALACHVSLYHRNKWTFLSAF